MPDEQRATGDTGPEAMLSYTPPEDPWTDEDLPADVDTYKRFLGWFGGAGVTPEGEWKLPERFEDPVFHGCAHEVYRTGQIPRGMRREVTQRMRELGMLPPSQGSKAGSSTAQGGGRQYQPGLLDRAEDWYMDGMGGASELVDQVLLDGATEHFGDTAGRHDAGQASNWELAKAAGNWGGRVGLTGYMGGQGLAAINRAATMGGPVAHWGPPSNWYMTGGRTPLNYGFSGVRQLGYPYSSGVTTVLPKGALRYPIPEEGRVLGALKGLIGQRVLR